MYMWNITVIQQDIFPELSISVVSKFTLLLGQEEYGHSLMVRAGHVSRAPEQWEPYHSQMGLAGSQQKAASARNCETTVLH